MHFARCRLSLERAEADALNKAALREEEGDHQRCGDDCGASHQLAIAVTGFLGTEREDAERRRTEFGRAQNDKRPEEIVPVRDH